VGKEERYRSCCGRERCDDQRVLRTEPPICSMAPKRRRDESCQRRNGEHDADLCGRETAIIEHDRQKREDRRLRNADKGEEHLDAAELHG
jgi:hypothetical protein